LSEAEIWLLIAEWLTDIIHLLRLYNYSLLLLMLLLLLQTLLMVKKNGTVESRVFHLRRRRD